MYFSKNIAKIVAIIAILSTITIFGDDSWQYGTNKIYDSNTSGCMGIGNCSPNICIRMTNANARSASASFAFMSYGTAALITKYGSEHAKSKNFEIAVGAGDMIFLTGAGAGTVKMRIFENGSLGNTDTCFKNVYCSGL